MREFHAICDFGGRFAGSDGEAAAETSDQMAPQSNAAPQRNATSQSKATAKRAAPVGLRGTPMCEQPVPTRRIQDAVPGNRNTTFYYRGRWWVRRHASEFATYPEFVAHWEPILYREAMRMDEPEETDARIWRGDSRSNPPRCSGSLRAGRRIRATWTGACARRRVPPSGLGCRCRRSPFGGPCSHSQSAISCPPSTRAGIRRAMLRRALEMHHAEVYTPQ